jgi:hypothetical protein
MVAAVQALAALLASGFGFSSEKPTAAGSHNPFSAGGVAAADASAAAAAVKQGSTAAKMHKIETQLKIMELQKKLVALQHAKSALASGSHTGAPPYPDMSRQPGRNIAMTNVWEQQFFGDIYIGHPAQKLTVVFDTGSSKLVANKGYDPHLSRTHRTLPGTFSIGYGSGGASGAAGTDTIEVGGWSCPGVLVAVPSQTSAYFSKFR